MFTMWLLQTTLLSILCVRFTPAHARIALGVSFLPFNSLCEIHSKEEQDSVQNVNLTFNSLCEILEQKLKYPSVFSKKLSILCVRFRQHLYPYPTSLWQHLSILCVRFAWMWRLNTLRWSTLSILCVRFAVIEFNNYWHRIHTFQFSVWDSDPFPRSLC